MENRDMEGIDRFLNNKIKVINLGIELFSDELTKQNIENIHVDWKPPAGGDDAILSLLRMLDTSRKE